MIEKSRSGPQGDSCLTVAMAEQDLRSTSPRLRPMFNFHNADSPERCTNQSMSGGLSTIHSPHPTAYSHHR
jgi:hypothetical protein